MGQTESFTKVRALVIRCQCMHAYKFNSKFHLGILTGTMSVEISTIGLDIFCVSIGSVVVIFSGKLSQLRCVSCQSHTKVLCKTMGRHLAQTLICGLKL